MTTPTPNIYTLSLHDALPIYLFAVVDGEHGPFAFKELHAAGRYTRAKYFGNAFARFFVRGKANEQQHVFLWKSPELEQKDVLLRSEEHTSELQSQSNLVCRLL